MKANINTDRNLFQKVFIAILIFSFSSFHSFGQVNEAAKAKPVKTGYAPVNGLKLYYEVYGPAVKPLVLLHGAFNTIDMAFGMLIPQLSKTRQVIAVELQGHGRTADIDRPFSFESMADDVAALLKHMAIDSADIFGYSMGGGTAWQVAIRHPKLVRRLIITSAVYKYDGWSAETRAILPMLTPKMFEPTPIKTEYDKLAPDPKHWEEFINKMKKFVTTTYDFGAEKIKAIKSPTLIIAADGDGVTPEHVVEMYRLRGGKYMVDFGPVPATQLAIYPGASHISVMMQTDWLVSITTSFLDGPGQKIQ
ncbi:MAG TPA: alpha/beta hydrolase [Chitinophagaceae bacterium]|nr:alpha/beta hydrolase [Chitinophagaceae bacterium]